MRAYVFLLALAGLKRSPLRPGFFCPSVWQAEQRMNAAEHACDRKGATRKIVDESDIERVYPTCSVCGVPQVLPSEDDVAAFRLTIAEMAERDKGNIENYDRALLTLSSAALAGSATFIKGVVEPEFAVLPYVLFASWAFLAATICATIISYMYAHLTIDAERQVARRMLLEKESAAYKEAEARERVMRGLGIVAGACFIAGLISLAVFVAINFQRESNAVTDTVPPNRRALPLSPPPEQFAPAPAAPQQQPAAQPSAQQPHPQAPNNAPESP